MELSLHIPFLIPGVPTPPVGDAEAKIENLVMTEGSRSVTYFVEFNRLASRIQWDNHALLRQAYKGLAHRIKNEMVHHNRPVTLRDLCKLIQTIDHRYWERKAEVTREANPMSRIVLEAVQVELSCTRGKSQTAVVITCTSRASTGLC